MRKINKIINIAVILMLIGAFACLDFAYSLPNLCLRPSHGFSEGKKNETTDNFWKAAGIINSSILAIKELKSETEIYEATVIEKAIFALEVQRARGVKIPWLHYDIIGGTSNIVKADNPEQTIKLLTPRLLRRIKEAAQKKGIFFVADVHIMVEEVDEGFIREYIDAGAGYITLHWEGYVDKNVLMDRIKFIKTQRCKAGVAFNPDIDIKDIIRFVSKNSLRDEIDLFLQMSVYPGKGGQKFMSKVLKNIPELKTEIGSSILIEIDGGIDPSTVTQAIDAGVNVLVAGSAFFGKGEQTRFELEQNLDAFISAIREGSRML